MNKPKTKILLLLLMTFLLTGCTTYLKDDNKKMVVNKETGQNLVANNLCKTDKAIEVYEKAKQDKINKYDEDLKANKITEVQYQEKVKLANEQFDLSKLVECKDMAITSGGYEGLWSTLFVKPLAFIIIKIGNFAKSYGVAIILVTILIRLAMYPLTKKTAVQSENMKKAKPKLDKLELKYRGKTDQQSQMNKSQEMLKIYKDNNISPMSGCLFAFIQIPLFFAFYEALYRLPVIFEGTFLGFKLGLTPATAFSNGNYIYLIFVVLVSVVTYFSFKLNATAPMAGDQEKTMKMVSNFSIIMISFASLTVSVGIALYWISNSGFTIIQNLLVKRGKKNADII